MRSGGRGVNGKLLWSLVGWKNLLMWVNCEIGGWDESVELWVYKMGVSYLELCSYACVQFEGWCRRRGGQIWGECNSFIARQQRTSVIDQEIRGQRLPSGSAECWGNKKICLGEKQPHNLRLKLGWLHRSWHTMTSCWKNRVQSSLTCVVTHLV